MPDHGAIAFSIKLRSGFGTIKLSSPLSKTPSPSQFIHAPNGLLNENVRGSIFGYEVPHSTHAPDLDKRVLSTVFPAASNLSQKASPPPAIKAEFIESVTLDRLFSRILIRSTTMSMS